MKTAFIAAAAIILFAARPIPVSAYSGPPPDTVAIHVSLVNGDEILFHVGSERPLRLNDRYEVFFGGKKWGEIIITDVFDTITRGHVIRGALSVLNGQVILLSRRTMLPGPPAAPLFPPDSVKTGAPIKLIDGVEGPSCQDVFYEPVKKIKLPPPGIPEYGETAEKGRAATPGKGAGKKAAPAPPPDISGENNEEKPAARKRRRSSPDSE